MEIYPFLDPGDVYVDPETAAAVVIPFPYEGSISYQAGTAQAPAAILEASEQVELYDERLQQEPVRMGIATAAVPGIPKDPDAMIDVMEQSVRPWLERGKFVAVIGGDHSISSGTARALLERYGRLSVIQLDAHADLRGSYEGSPLSHASVMARIREMTPHTLQIGIRSLCREEADIIRRQQLPVCFMHDWEAGTFDLESAVHALPDPVFITLDVDVFDTGLIQHTGTPEPGGLRWAETLDLLQLIFSWKQVVGVDVVELSVRPDDWASPFAVAKLIYKMMGFKLASAVAKGRLPAWPETPAGAVL